MGRRSLTLAKASCYSKAMFRRLLAGAFVVVALIVPVMQLALPLDADAQHVLKDRPDAPRAWRSGLPATSVVGDPGIAFLTYLRFEDPGAIPAVVPDVPFVPPRL